MNILFIILYCLLKSFNYHGTIRKMKKNYRSCKYVFEYIYIVYIYIISKMNILFRKKNSFQNNFGDKQKIIFLNKFIKYFYYFYTVSFIFL